MPELFRTIIILCMIIFIYIYFFYCSFFTFNSSFYTNCTLNLHDQ